MPGAVPTGGVGECQSCGESVAQSELALSERGDWLCRRCHAEYRSLVLTDEAHRAEVHRRCRCGAVLAPIGEDPPAYSGGELNLEFFFQPHSFVCSRCARTFSERHPVITLLFAGVGVLMGLAGLSVSGEKRVFTLAFAAAPLAYAAYDVMKRLRHPRIR